MAQTWIPASWHDLIIDRIMQANYQSVCSQRPLTFYEAVWPDTLWAMSTPYSEGTLVYAPTDNGCIYECTSGGTSGAAEPGWGTNQDQTFSDGSVTWKTHKNYSLVRTTMQASDFEKTDIPNGKNLKVAEKANILIHRTGTIACSVLMNTTTKELLHSTQAASTTAGAIEKGNLTIMFEYNIQHIAQQ